MKITQFPRKYASLINKISVAARENGYDVFAVGGFVRDLFIGRDPNDLDIMALSLNPLHEQRLSGINFSKIVSQKYGLSEPVVFERFGTAKLFIEGHEVEFVMPRKEYYDDDSRNPDTELGSLEQDALRRDFTVNALFLRLSDMEVLDLTKKGVSDIENKIIRAADSTAADIIFKQDPLRILRALRQSLQLGYSIESETFRAMKEAVKRIDIVSPERIRGELDKILAQPFPSAAFKAADEINLLCEILPSVAKLKGLPQPAKYHDKDAFGHTLDVVDRVKNEPVLRMSALLHDIGKYETFKNENGKISFYGHEKISAENAAKILKDLKYPKDFAASVANTIKNHMYPKTYLPVWSDAAVRRMVLRCKDDFDYALELSKADYGVESKTDVLDALLERINKLKEKKTLYPNFGFLDGKFLIEHFNLPGGIWVKKVKESLNEALIENPSLTKEEALKIAGKILKSDNLI
jgi:putative nucleotidyltransferase with HDIG domain